MNDNIIRLHDSPRPTAPPVEHLLRAIRDSRGEEQWSLQKRAYQYFAELNGWKVGSKKRWCPFDLKVLQRPIFDHYRSFDKAMVTEPYAHRNWYDDGMTIAARYEGRFGLAFHMSPYPTASIYSPGQCAFLIFTRPGHVMKWLPEMINGIDGEVTS
jgi:hypothetical protein